MKLTAEELRIGNLVEINASYGQVQAIDEYNNIKLFGYYPFCEIKPIPLTEEILFKIEGFKDGKIETDRFIFSIQFYDGWNIYYKDKSSYGATEYSSVGFPSLHELQNLFHSLSVGQELNVKL